MDAFPHRARTRTAFLIADVAGKGLGAALLTTMLQGALSGMTLGVEPAKVFDHINRFLCDHAVVGRYATLFFGHRQLGNARIHQRRPSLAAASARRRSAISTLRDRFRWAWWRKPNSLLRACNLSRGIRWCCLPMALWKPQHAEKHLFGFERLRRLAQWRMCLDRNVQKTILDEVEEFSRGAGQADDLTLVVVRYRKSEP